MAGNGENRMGQKYLSEAIILRKVDLSLPLPNIEYNASNLFQCYTRTDSLNWTSIPEGKVMDHGPHEAGDCAHRIVETKGCICWSRRANLKNSESLDRRRYSDVDLDALRLLRLDIYEAAEKTRANRPK